MNLTPDTAGADAFNINNKSQVVGRILVPDPKERAVAHAFLRQEGAWTDLGVPGGFGDDNSEANSLNDNGQIVGDSGVGFIEGYAPDHALLWENGELPTRLPSRTSALAKSSAVFALRIYDWVKGLPRTHPNRKGIPSLIGDGSAKDL